jgi:predicted metalloendopeptidase
MRRALSRRVRPIAPTSPKSEARRSCRCGQEAQAIFDLESEIAKLHWSRAERRNAEKVYNPMSVAELEKFAPQFPWRAYLNELGIPAPSKQRAAS